MNNTLKKTISSLRGFRGLKQKELAQKTGISEAQLSIILNRGSCTTKDLIKILDVLECDLVIKSDIGEFNLRQPLNK